uniref:Uncharacterized protein n=1 Tax=Candidatus Kentrum sp. UNK TaxID=2126344 RepID=A0A451B6B6_9GAMM|nr:MAG: hypothetical protein BECKUNK1418G_GA0071005_13171 [Candidatus Kentron sp. UNK]VFK73823.1 MAG: hypothetical protein BECKUNK1418H_GA0071006_13071 [Candidatus Kentron sp. UNK]
MTTILQSKDYSGKAVLYMAMELSNAKWKLGFSNGSRDRSVTIVAGDWKASSQKPCRTRFVLPRKNYIYRNIARLSAAMKQGVMDFGFTVCWRSSGLPT